MAADPLKILVFEDEYFIALDIQRALSENLDAAVDIVQTRDVAGRLRQEAFGLAVVGLSSSRDVNRKIGQSVEESGGALVFTSGYSPASEELAGGGRWPIVEIPFPDEALVYAARQALKARADQP